jgi:hypothetical protein
MPYDAETFIEVIRTGKQNGLDPIMPWIAFRNLTDRDLRAMHAYLQTVPPVTHHINNHAEPTYCSVCGQMHGLGQMNRPYQPTGISLRPEVLGSYTGIYYSAEDDFRLEIALAGDRLVARVDGEDPVDITFVSEARMLIPGEPTALDIVFVDGRAAQLQTVQSSPYVLQKRGRPRPIHNERASTESSRR